MLHRQTEHSLTKQLPLDEGGGCLVQAFAEFCASNLGLHCSALLALATACLPEESHGTCGAMSTIYYSNNEYMITCYFTNNQPIITVQNLAVLLDMNNQCQHLAQKLKTMHPRR